MGLRAWRLSVASFGGLVLLSAGLAGLIHRVSPLRDPSFEVNGANAGTLVPWLQWVSEAAWLRTSVALATLLALSATWMFCQWSQQSWNRSPDDQRQWTGERWRNAWWIVVAIVLFIALGFSGWAIAFLNSPDRQIGLFKLVIVAIVAVLLTLNFTGMVCFLQRLNITLAQLPEPARTLQRWGQAYRAMYWAGFTASLFTALQILFLGYLLAQHMVD